MKHAFISFLLMMGTIQAQAQDQDFWIFLCYGQSNMAGQAPIEQQDLTVSDRYLSMATTDGIDGRKLGTWRKAIPPLCRADAHLGPVNKNLSLSNKKTHFSHNRHGHGRKM